jgi:hypothetical protein
MKPRLTYKYRLDLQLIKPRFKPLVWQQRIPALDKEKKKLGSPSQLFSVQYGNNHTVGMIWSTLSKTKFYATTVFYTTFKFCHFGIRGILVWYEKLIFIISFFALLFQY